MDFRILGPLEVEDDGRIVRLAGTKPRSLLALLLLNSNEAVSRDRLIDEVWGDEPPETVATAVQVHISQLRKALGRDVIVTQPPGYLIRVGDDELDLTRFEQAVTAARGAPPSETSELLSAALALWRGPPLAELDAPFARAARARLEEQRLEALEQRIEADLELGRHAQLVPELEGLVRGHPLRERLRGQLMLALYRSGRQADALDAYRSGRRLLDEELGLEPGEELRRLERAILAQDESIAVSAPPPSRRPEPAHVPAGTVTFLFTDIEGSTRLVQTLGEGYGALLEQHHGLVRGVLESHGGEEVDTQGDAFFFAFRRARDAVRGAVELQKQLADAHWPADAVVRIRIGIHTGEPGLAETGYHGLDVVRAARISGSAHGGQILVSSATRDLVGVALEDVFFEDLGEHRLKDLEQPQRISQVVAPGLATDFPPLATAAAARVMSIGGREEELAAAAEAALETEERRVRWFRRSRVVALVGAVVLIAALAAAALAITTGSSPASVAVTPDSVAMVEPESGRVAADVRVGGRPIALAAGYGAIWVADADDGTLLRIDPASGEVVKTIGLGADVNSIAIGFGSVWVAGGNDETLFRIDPSQNALVATVHFGTSDPLHPDPIFFVAAGRRAVWVTRRDSVVGISPATNEIAKTIPLPAHPTDLGAGAGNVWVVTVDERLVRIDESSTTISETVQLPGGGASPVIAGGALWLIVFTENPGVWKFDPRSLTQTATAPLGDGFHFALAGGEGSVWAVDHDKGAVWKIDPRSTEATKLASVAFHPISVTAGEGAVWVGVQERPFR
jgi:DNA-binding SARP family transcriptional activator/streptogramin lyase